LTALLPGTQVQARGLRWEVVFTQPAGDQTLYRLRCQDGWMRGEEFDLLCPFEEIRPLTTEMDPTKADLLHKWRVYHQAFLLEQALGPQALLTVQPGRLQLAPYQLVPVMRALSMSRPRLMLADGVGLGKTVEAGLVLSELIARRRAHRILIVSPAGPLLHQWRDEMRERFGLRFEILDRDSLQETRRRTELGSNPFDHEALGLISFAFARQEKVLRDLERTQYDVVVLDEAHHYARLGAAGDREDTLSRKLAEVLARQSDALLLLTATPHDGFDAHFASLVQLLDPSLVDGSGVLRGDRYRRHMVRRLKSHLPGLFRTRQVEPRKVTFTQAGQPLFTQFQQGLLALVAPQLRRAVRARRFGDVLAFLALMKRSVSTAQACAGTLDTIAARLDELARTGGEDQETRRERLGTLRDYRRRIERFGVLGYEEEQDQAQLEAEDMAAELARLTEQEEDATREVRRERDRLRRLEEVRDRLRALADLARQATAEDPKPAAVLREVQAIREAQPDANILIYTEYSDSQEFLAQVLRGAGLEGEVLALSGKDPEKDRTEVARRFTEERGLVLVSTDATAEGLNLHARCHHLLHLELPYNPNRLEQRNGRIDRFGQKHDPLVRYLYLAGTFEERLLLLLVSKYERQRRALTHVPNTLGFLTSDTGAATVKLLEGLAEEDGQLFSGLEGRLDFGVSPEKDEETASPEYRDLLAEVEKAFSGFTTAARTNVWLAEGMASDPRSVQEAEGARQRGDRLGAVDLVSFVSEAVKAGKGKVQGPDGEGILTLNLPPSWTQGLRDLPGLDTDHKILRLTRDIHVTRNARGQDVGFLGRAHPIVRRALDRVRNLQFGSDGSELDRRVSAATSPGPHPELLFTFLAGVDSGAGRELERVVAVRVPEAGAPTVQLESSDWIALAGPDRDLATAGVWERHFAGWDRPARQEAARAAVQEAFRSVADAFAADHRKTLEREQEELESWLRLRTSELCGTPTSEQLGLFGGQAAEIPAWRTQALETDRLAAFASGPSNRTGSRHEARSVLELYRRRSADLERRGRLNPPAVVPLGLLMLVPGGGDS